jgi:hypothetical protein
MHTHALPLPSPRRHPARPLKATTPAGRAPAAAPGATATPTAAGRAPARWSPATTGPTADGATPSLAGVRGADRLSPASARGADRLSPACTGVTKPDPARADAVPVLLRRARLVALAVGGFLLPWCVLLGATLPATAQAQHWPAAWVGLDAGEALAALATAALLAREDARAAVTAAAGGALLLTDAWFDVCTSAPGLDHAVAVAEAAFVELPLAGAAFWLAVRLTRSRTR